MQNPFFQPLHDRSFYNTKKKKSPTRTRKSLKVVQLMINGEFSAYLQHWVDTPMTFLAPSRPTKAETKTMGSERERKEEEIIESQLRIEAWADLWSVHLVLICSQNFVCKAKRENKLLVFFTCLALVDL